MGLSGWFVIVPSGFAALHTGVSQAVGTPWGLFEHYRVVVKLVLTVAATGLLLVHLRPISYLAGVAAKADLSSNELRGLRLRLLADAVAAFAVLLAATTISVYQVLGTHWQLAAAAQTARRGGGHAHCLGAAGAAGAAWLGGGIRYRAPARRWPRAPLRVLAYESCKLPAQSCTPGGAPGASFQRYLFETDPLGLP